MLSARYLSGLGLAVRYLHSEVETIERVEILRDLRLGKFDVLVGINLLREGLDLPDYVLVNLRGLAQDINEEDEFNSMFF